MAQRSKPKGGAAASASLPSPVDRFVAAVNGGDAKAFLAFFPADGVVDDWGTRYVGRDAIRTWSDREFIGAKGRMAVTAASQKGNVVTVDAGWKSNFHTGESRFVFVLDGERIREMRIVER